MSTDSKTKILANGTLYVVSTPIGNMEDITVRAMRILNEVNLIAAEDTRVTRKLLTHFNISTPTTSYHEHNKHFKLPSILKILCKKNVALVSDAGTPTLNDPGAELVASALDMGIKVVPIPGTSSITSAISVSGFAVDQFLFTGFIPRKRGNRMKFLNSISMDKRTIVAFETPHRLKSSLSDILVVLGDRQIVVCRELTKLYEEVCKTTVSKALDKFNKPRGEFTLVINGATLKAIDTELEKTAIRALRFFKSEGFRSKEAVALVVEQTNLPQKQIYGMWLEINDLTN